LKRLFYGTFANTLQKYCEPKKSDLKMAALLIPAAFTEKDSDLSWGETDVSKYMNGRRTFTDKLMGPYLRPEARKRVINHFAKELITLVPDNRRADLKHELLALIKADGFIAKEQKASFAASASKKALHIFLAEVYLYAIRQEVKPDKPPFPFNNFPHKQNLFFEGRENQLKHIHKQFGAGKVVALTQTMTGTGGVGKTQIALEYGYRYAPEYDTIWWVASDTPQTMFDAAFVFLGRKKMPEICESEAVVRGTFAAWFEQNDRWLLIFDNVDNFEALMPYLPKNNNGNILITTRLQRGIVGKKVDIAVFSEEEAVAFLLRRAERKDTEGAAELARRLGYLPLALEQAAAFLAGKKKYSFTDYIAMLEQHGLDMFERDDEITDYKLPVTATWQISLGKITMDSARQLLNLIACFASDRIPLSLFVKHADCLPEPLRSDIQNELLCGDIVDELTKYSLVKSEDTEDGDTELSLHRLLQEVISSNVPDGDAYLKCCLRVFFAACSSQSTQDRADFHNLIVHVNEVAARAEKQLTDPESRKLLMGVCHQIADYFSGQGDYPKALRYLKQTLRVCKALFGRSHRLTADLCTGIGRVYSAMKSYDNAIYYYQRAAKIQLAVFGKACPEVAGTYNNLANAYKNMGDYANAKEWYEQSLSIKKEALGAEHPDTLLTQCNMAQMVALLGDKESALVLHHEVREARERVLGLLNNDTAVSYEYIALLYLEEGGTEEALRWLHKALDVYVEIHGEENLTTAATNHRIAYACHQSGDLIQAMEFYLAALTVRGKVLGQSHPDTVTTRNLMKQCREIVESVTTKQPAGENTAEILGLPQ